MDGPAKRTSNELKRLKIGMPREYIFQLHQVMIDTQVTSLLGLGGDADSQQFSLDYGIDFIIELLKKRMSVEKRRLMIIGNGGSAAIAMHMLMDYVNVGDIRTMDFTSPALLTCMANDYGWEYVFAVPIKKFAEQRDVLFAISSSGQSKNILNACDAATERACAVVTFSGMNADNPLRRKGILNFYVPSTHYGFIELAHETLLHAILDLFVRAENHVN